MRIYLSYAFKGTAARVTLHAKMEIHDLQHLSDQKK